MVNNETIALPASGVTDAKNDIKRKATLAGGWIVFLPAAALSAIFVQLLLALVG
jgi:hypothetical protein